MASTFSPNLGLELQGTGDNSGTWGGVLNSNALAIVDAVMGDVQTLSLSSTNVTVSTPQSQKNYIKLTGVLTASVDVTFPAIGRTYFISNETTGNFTVTLKCAGGGTSVVIPRGVQGFYVLDATNIVADQPYFGARSDLAGATTTSLGTIPSRNVNVTGSGWSCTSFGSVADTVAPIYFLTFAAAGTLVNGANLVLPGAANITTGAGDSAIAMYLGAGAWKVVSYQQYASAPASAYQFYQRVVYTSNNSYTPSGNTRLIRVIMTGGGGGAGGARATDSGEGSAAAAGGGGAGETADFYMAIGDISAPVSVTIGAAGTGGTSSGTNGSNGGTSSFGAYAIATGGSGSSGISTGGYSGTDGALGGTGGTVPSGGLLYGGGDGASSVIGDGGSGSQSINAMSGNGGNSFFGGGGRGRRVTGTSSAGGNGNAYGAGGGGAASKSTGGAAGGNGFPGVVIIEEYT